MSFGQALSAIIGERNETQEGPARATSVSTAAISKYIRGTRQPSNDVIRSAVAHYDDAALTLAAYEEVAGEASVPWLNNADLHKSTVHLKAQEEVSEANEAIQAVPITKRKDQITEADLLVIKAAITECIEAITALTHYVAVLCKEYTFSWLGMWKAHRQKLKDSKYLK